MVKKIATLCLAVSLLFTSFGGVVDVNASVSGDAYFSVATGAENSFNIDVRTTSATSPVRTQIGSEFAWKINNDTNSRMLFDVDASLGNSADDGSSYTIEIEYYDHYDYSVEEGDLSFFSIWVDKLNYGMQRIQDVSLLGDDQWKKVTIEVEDAAFASYSGSLTEADIMLRLYDQKGVEDYASTQHLYFKSLVITKNIAKNPVLVESYIENVGNTFTYSEGKKVMNTFTNTTDAEVSLVAEYFMVDGSGNVKFSFKEDVVIPAKGEEERIVTVDSQECGLYQWIVKISDSTGNINSRFLEDTIAIVKTANDGLKNETAWIMCHLERYRKDRTNPGTWPELTNEQAACIELINKANITGTRLQTTWYMTQYSTGDEPGSLNIEGTYFWHAAKHLYDAGIDFWVMLSGCANGFSDHVHVPSKMPATEAEVNGWEAFCKHVIEKYANTYGVELFEIWNEPNVNDFNPISPTTKLRGTPENLAEITKRARKAANELYDEGRITKPVKVAGLSVTALDNPETKVNWLEPAVAAGIADSENGMNVLNVHTYAHGQIPETAKTYQSVQKYRDYISENTDIKNIPVLISEYGNPLVEGTTEQERSDWNIRSAILYRMRGIGNQLAIYNLEQKGAITNWGDDHYGLVSPAIKELNIEGKVGIPTESYLTYAAMNYILRGKVEPVKIIDCGENVNVNHLKRTTFGDEALALWAAYDDAEITLDLGVDSVTYYDKFGNERVMTSSDGTYNIPLTTSVSYITGNFTKVEAVKGEQVFYDGFSDYICTTSDWRVPDGWTLKSLSDSERDAGTNLAAVSGTYGTSVRLGSNGEGGLFRHPALYQNVGYAITDDTPVRFHTDVKIEDDRGIMDKLTGCSVNNNNYHICVSKASDIEDYSMGFKLVGESNALSVHYWDEEENDFVESGKTFSVDEFLSLDAIYYPAAKPKVNGMPYSQTFDSDDVIDTETKWTSASTKWGSNDNTGKLSVSYVASEGDRNGVLKATTTDTQYKQLRSPADFNLPVDETTEYVDIMFDYKSAPTDSGKDVYTIIALRTDKLDRYTGIQIDEERIYALAGNAGYVKSPSATISNVLGLWKSYKLRYYPHKGKLEVFMGDTQQTISDTPVLSTELYTTASGGNASTDKLIWDSATHGSKITGIGFQMNQLNSNMYLDNVRGASYSYSNPNVTDTVEYYVNGDKVGEGKSGLSSNKSLETVMLASHTKASNGRFSALYDNVCIMPETQDSVFFEEKRHSEEDGMIEFKTTAVNISNLTDEVTIISVFYDEQKNLVDVTITPASLNGKFVEMSSGQSVMAAEGLQAKFFIWDMDDLRPLSKVYKVRYN